MSIFDGHIHSPFCPHGSTDSFEKYIEQAINIGYKKMTFTEHAPLPNTFTDPVPLKDSAMEMNNLDRYINQLNKLKFQYKDHIQIHIGLEVDYIEGFERETKDLLNNWGNALDDSILSVHFLKCPNNQFICLDYSPASFEDLVHQFSSIQDVYKSYYRTVQMSIDSDLGHFKPKRIGHFTLVRKFQKLFPRTFDDSQLIEDILMKLGELHYSIDVNGAGLFKPYCKELYPPIRWVRKAIEMNIPIVYGSDAHQSDQLGQGLSQICKEIDLSNL
ncbi:histidinol-phosphatase HisJ [Evansella sp. AB-P1]|uniref:histidinol-phosphatase HisJ n=1 Tax=Evansella sp. AB-P1 TaxID=3037653 RepID=UPI00241EAC31|nr:histidinol-phosphatase HisJ [Evansella sp. AB-P1]MDG5787016.1 histidinol-phosphatase HisJ [Evansella sp. AB-P1]